MESEDVAKLAANLIRQGLATTQQEAIRRAETLLGLSPEPNLPAEKAVHDPILLKRMPKAQI